MFHKTVCYKKTTTNKEQWDGRVVAGVILTPIQRLLSLYILKYKTGKEKR